MNTHTPRELLAAAITDLQGAETRLADHSHKISALLSQIGLTADIERQIHDLDTQDAWTFADAAKAGTIDDVEIDSAKRVELQKRLAITRAKDSCIRQAVKDIEGEQSHDSMVRDSAHKAMTERIFAVILAEVAKTAEANAIRHRRELAYSVAQLETIYETGVSLSHPSVEELGAVVRRVKEGASLPPEAREHLGEFIGALHSDASAVFSANVESVG
jgi:hypothetical protein